jgi:AcrR family transcriptional regulator
MVPPEPDTQVRPLYPTLSGGPGRLSPEEVARNQRGRLQGAMVEAVSRHGFAGTTLRELVGLAGVSKSTFYEHFENKQACFFATFDAIAAELARRVIEVDPGSGDLERRFTVGLDFIMQTVVEEPAAAHLVAVESLTLGSAAEEHRERSWRGLERMVKAAFDQSPSGIEVSEMAVRTIVGGLRGVIYRRLRDGRLDLLPSYVGELVDRGLRFQRRAPAAVGDAGRAAERTPVIEARQGESELLGWEEPPDSMRSRAALTQRDRIVRAAARVVCDRGYDGLSVPVISGTAGVSNQTFYEHFASKRDAFLEAYDVLSQRAFELWSAAFGAAGGGVEGIGAGLRVLLEYAAADRFYAHIAFLELPSAGPLGLDRFDQTNDRFAALLKGSHPSDEPPSDVVLGAIGSGIWDVIRHEIAHGRADGLPALSPQIARLAVTPQI